mmetsp:Transcript_46540/g.99433  ORF Transcript_46540/g.99433 Transcript_46540/m.99433 type:complete len:86 (-) Transcript_46540:233-490(-)
MSAAPCKSGCIQESKAKPGAAVNSDGAAGRSGDWPQTQRKVSDNNPTPPALLKAATRKKSACLERLTPPNAAVSLQSIWKLVPRA